MLVSYYFSNRENSIVLGMAGCMHSLCRCHSRPSRQHRASRRWTYAIGFQAPSPAAERSRRPQEPTVIYSIETKPATSALSHLCRLRTYARSTMPYPNSALRGYIDSFFRGVGCTRELCQGAKIYNSERLVVTVVLLSRSTIAVAMEVPHEHQRGGSFADRAPFLLYFRCSGLPISISRIEGQSGFTVSCLISGNTSEMNTTWTRTQHIFICRLVGFFSSAVSVVYLVVAIVQVSGIRG